MISRFSDERVFIRRGFTLLELLVSMAVLSILIAMLAQAVTLTGQAISLNAKKLNAAGQARLVFDRLAADVAARPHRSDLGMQFIIKNGTGSLGANDSLQFYSEVAGYSGPRQVSGVGYRIRQMPTGRIYQLERGAVGTDWAAVSPSNSIPLVQFLPGILAGPADPDPDYDVLSSDAFRLGSCYLLNTGLFSNSNGSKLTGAAAATDFSNVTAIVVTLAILDDASGKLVNDDQLRQLAQALPNNQEGEDPISSWTTALKQPGFAPGVPPLATQAVRLYQRTFCVP